MSTTRKYETLPLPELIARLRKQAWVWFKNDDILLLDELIRRTERMQGALKMWEIKTVDTVKE